MPICQKCGHTHDPRTSPCPITLKAPKPTPTPDDLQRRRYAEAIASRLSIIPAESFESWAERVFGQAQALLAEQHRREVKEQP